MKGAFEIGTFRGIKIAIHWSFFILLIWVAGRNYMEGMEPASILLELSFVLAVFFCVLLHELGHALMAARFSVKTRDITLLPIGGVARLEKMPEKPIQEFLVAVAGPAVNVVIVLLLLPFILLGKGWPVAIDLEVISQSNYLANVILVNASLLIFNLIPAFPMDGGRVLRSLLAMRLPREKATRIAATTGQFFAVVFAIVGLYFNPFLILIAVFIFMGARSEYKMVLEESYFSNLKVKNVMIRKFDALESGQTLQDAADLLLSGYSTDFLVMKNHQVEGVLTRDDLLKAFAAMDHHRPLDIILRFQPPSVQENDSLKEVWSIMRSGNWPLLPVYDQMQLTGIVSVENIAEFFALQNANAPQRK